MSVKIKKTVLDSEGRIVEEYEGTEEEVAAYESKKAKRSQTESAKKQRTVLHGKDLDDIRGVVREELSKLPAPSVQLVPYLQPAPIYPQPSLWPVPYWGALPTITVTTDTVQVPSPATIQEPPSTSGALYSSLMAHTVPLDLTVTAWNGVEIIRN